MVGWHHRLNGHEFEQAPGVGDGQGGRAPEPPISPIPDLCPYWTQVGWLQGKQIVTHCVS